MYYLITHTAYFAVIVLLASTVQPGYLGDLEGAEASLFIIGFLGLWRYSWAGINFTRAMIFRRVIYPRRKAKAFAKFKEAGLPSHTYFMITSFMVEPEVTVPVYRNLFDAAANAKDGATIVASIVHGADGRLIQQIFDTHPRDMSNVQLILDRIEANGKRDALAKSLDIIGKMNPTSRDILVFVDGDTMVPPEIAAASAPMFTNPKVGALTTDEGVMIHKKNLFRDWFIMRFNQRQVMMCSMGVSNRVLTLTGRMSVFRADLATDPSFIEQVRNDFLDHWRLGRVNFLTGDDKSTWYWLLKNGYETAYLPDVRSWSWESQPKPTFIGSAGTLMVRWFGNMMRTNGRALQLRPRDIGRFTWWSILDQRVSMWTTLVGPLTVLLTAIMVDPGVIPLYIAWVMATRYIFCIVLSLFRGTWFPITHPFTLYFGQVVGAAVKTFVFFRLDKQKWTRQKTSLASVKQIGARAKALESTTHHVIAVTFLVIGIMFLTKV